MFTKYCRGGEGGRLFHVVDVGIATGCEAPRDIRILQREISPQLGVIKTELRRVAGCVAAALQPTITDLSHGLWLERRCSHCHKAGTEISACALFKHDDTFSSKEVIKAQGVDSRSRLKQIASHCFPPFSRLLISAVGMRRSRSLADI